MMMIIIDDDDYWWWCWWLILLFTHVPSLADPAKVAHVGVSLGIQEFVLAHGTSRFLRPEKVQDLKRRKSGADLRPPVLQHDECYQQIQRLMFCRTALQPWVWESESSGIETSN